MTVPILNPRPTQIAKFMRPTWAHLGPAGSIWAPCWPHEPCYQGRSLIPTDKEWRHLWSEVLHNSVNMSNWHYSMMSYNNRVWLVHEVALCSSDSISTHLLPGKLVKCGDIVHTGNVAKTADKMQTISKGPCWNVASLIQHYIVKMSNTLT